MLAVAVGQQCEAMTIRVGRCTRWHNSRDAQYKGTRIQTRCGGGGGGEATGIAIDEGNVREMVA